MTPEGLFDMAGCVWEWCGDRYDEGTHGRAVRGGSFVDGGDGLRCAARLRISPRYHSNDVGFRVVRAV
jgi:formylglycine-generating enzyme required for sulfatase activity